MEELADTFVVEQFDQLRAIADPLRSRILEQLVLRPMTMSQLGEVFGETTAKIHYHVRELEKYGFLRLVEKRERGGFIEKYYRAVAREINVAPDLLRTTPPSELGSTVQGYLDEMKRGVMRTITYGNAHPEAPFCFTWESASLWMTQDELKSWSSSLMRFSNPFDNHAVEQRSVIGLRISSLTLRFLQGHQNQEQQRNQSACFSSEADQGDAQKQMSGSPALSNAAKMTGQEREECLCLSTMASLCPWAGRWSWPASRTMSRPPSCNMAQRF